MPDPRPAILLLIVLLVVLVPVRAENADGDDELKARLRALVTDGKWGETLKVADEALATCPESVVAWQYRAYSLHRIGKKDDAGVAYEKTVELDPDNWWAFLNLAELRASQDRREPAVKAAERAVTLNPKSVDVRTRVSRIHREAREYETALAAARLALESGVEAAWCHAELGYLYWVLGNAGKSLEHWKAAKEAGADRARCAHGMKLVVWDRPRGSRREKEEVARRRLGFGEQWEFDVDGVRILTRVGPRLPAEIEKLIGKLKQDQAKVLGVDGKEDWGVYLHLSRTLEEHEVHREREFPSGYSSKAFVVPRWGGWRGRRGRGPGRGGTRRHELDVYIAWPEAGLSRSLAHELAHAMIRLRMPRASWPPVWLDEGIATYLEVTRGKGGRLELGQVREDLLASLRKAKSDGSLAPLAELCRAERPQFTGRLARVRYAQSWVLVHWLITGQKSGGKQRWQAFLDRWNAPGRPAAGEFLAAIYGMKLPEMERAVAAHIESLSD